MVTAAKEEGDTWKVKLWRIGDDGEAKDNHQTISVGEPVKLVAIGKPGVAIASAKNPASGKSGTLSFWDMTSEKPKLAKTGGPRLIHALSYNDQAKHFVTVSIIKDEGKLVTTRELWEPNGEAKGDPMKLEVGADTAPTAAVIARDDTLAIARPQAGVAIFAPGESKPKFENKQVLESKTISALALSDNKTLLAAGGYEEVEIWNISENRLLRTLRPGNAAVLDFRTLNFSHDDGRLLAAADTQGRIIVWNTQDGSIVNPPGDTSN